MSEIISTQLSAWTFHYIHISCYRHNTTMVVLSLNEWLQLICLTPMLLACWRYTAHYCCSLRTHRLVVKFQHYLPLPWNRLWHTHVNGWAPIISCIITMFNYINPTQLLSYGDTFTLFDIDCSDSTQLLLLGSFLRLRPVLDSTYTFLQGFGCETDGSYNDQWLANNVPTYTEQLRQLNMLPSNMS